MFPLHLNNPSIPVGADVKMPSEFVAFRSAKARTFAERKATLNLILIPSQSVSNPRRGFTLVELMMGMTITAMLAVVLGGLINAVQTASDHTKGQQTANTQGRVAIERVKYMVSQAGVYQLSGQPTRHGIEVVNHNISVIDFPDVLVVWSGGRGGGMVEAGVLNRLPQVNELVIFAADPTDPERLVEITIPSDSSGIDFDDSDFSDDILTLISSIDAEMVLLCDRIRATRFSKWRARLPDLANIRFELSVTPSDDEIAAAVPGSDDWNGLMWAQGIVSGDSGMRQVTLRTEFQVQPNENIPADTYLSSIAIPNFGSASYRYVYEP